MSHSSILSSIENILGRGSSKKSSTKKRSQAGKERKLHVESLEKREMLSVSPASASFEDTGWVYFWVSVAESAQSHSIDFTVGNNSFSLGSGDANADKPKGVPVKPGDTLTYVLPEDVKVRAGGDGLSGSIALEDWIDDDYNDLVVKYIFVSGGNLTGAEIPTLCECADEAGEESSAITDPGGNLSCPSNQGYKIFRLSGSLPEIPSEVGGNLTVGSVKFSLSMAGQAGTEVEDVYTDASEEEDGESYTAVFQIDVSSFPTSIYEWTGEMVCTMSDGSTFTSTYTSTTEVVNLNDSLYGAGFNVSGVSSLHLGNANDQDYPGILWARSCGKVVWFDNLNGTLTPRNGESVNALLEQNPDGTYTLTDNGETFSFNAQGQLVQRDTMTGGQVNWAYDSSGRVTTKTEEHGRETSFAYSQTTGLLQTVTDALGRTTNYSYDAQGRLMSVTLPDPDGNGSLPSPVTSYTYDGTSNRVLQKTDSDGTVTEYGYDGKHLVSVTVNGVTQKTQATFRSQGIVDTDVLGYDENNPAPYQSLEDVSGSTTNTYGKTTQYRKDNYGNVIWKRDAAGNETWSNYDKNGNILTEMQVLLRSNGQKDLILTSYEYDTRGNLTKITYNDGTTERWTYDGTHDQVTSYVDTAGNTTLYTIDPITGLTTKEQVVVGRVDSISNGETDDIITTYVYNNNRQLVEMTDPMGMVTVYTYNSAGWQDSETTAYGTAYAATAYGTAYAATTYSTYDAMGKVVAVTDALGRTTNYVYDNLDRRIETIYPAADANSQRLSTQSVYNSLGQLYQSIDTYGNVTTYAYNTDGQISQITYQDPDGTGPAVSSTVTYTYNAYGDLWKTTDSLGKVTRYEYNAGGKLIATYLETIYSTASTRVSATTYDNQGRVATETDATGVTIAYTYDWQDRVVKIVRTNDNLTLQTSTYNALGQLVATTDVTGAKTTYTYDSLGNMATVTTADGATTSYSYDKLGRATTITDALGNITSYTYDITGNLTAVTDALNNSTYFTYDILGNQLTQTDALGNTTSYVYDNLGRTISTTLTSADQLETITRTTTYGTTTVNGVTYRYVTSTDALNHSTTSTYNAAGQLIQSVAADNATTTYTYDSEGQLLTTTDALNRTTTYVYDHFDNRTQTILPDNTVYTALYNAAGQVVAEIDPMGVTTSYTYNLNGQVTTTTVTEARDDGDVPPPVGSWLEDGQYFNGTSTSVNLGNPSELNFTGEITISAWIKPEAINGSRVILEHGYTFNPNREVFLRIVNGKYQIGSWNGSTYYAEFAIPAEDIGNWVHLAGTYDGTHWNLYRNGELVASAAASVGAVTVNADWHIGAANGNSRWFKGEIRDVAIRSEGLSGDEVASLYASYDRDSITTAATFNAAGWMTSQTDAMGNTTTYTYDSMGRMLTVTDALSNVAAYTYDTLGRIATQTDPLGLVTAYRYDAVGNLLETAQFDGNELPVPAGQWLEDSQSFNGSSTTINLGNSAELNFSGEITLSAWIKPEAIDGNRSILDHGAASNREVYL